MWDMITYSNGAKTWTTDAVRIARHVTRGEEWTATVEFFDGSPTVTVVDGEVQR